MEKPHFRLLLVELPVLTGMQPQTEGVRGFACSEGKDIRSSPEVPAATAIFCSELTFMCWSKGYNAPRTGSQAELATPATATKEIKRQEIFYITRTTNSQKFMLKKEKKLKKLRLVPRLPRQHPGSCFRYLSDTSLGANYLLQFPAFLVLKSIPLWAKNVTLYWGCQSPCCIVSGDRFCSTTSHPCSHTVPQAQLSCSTTYFLMEDSCIFLLSVFDAQPGHKD